MPEVLTEVEKEDPKKKFRDYVLQESKKGNVVFSTFDGYGVAPLAEFIKQPADGILYDLNRLPEVVLTFINDPKWVNDFAVYQVIKALREQADNEHTQLKDSLAEKAANLRRLAILHARYVGPVAIEEAAKRYREAESELFTAVDALIAFEREHKINE